MTSINANIQSVTAFAPATVSNLAVGFDILGFALEAPGDRVTLQLREDGQIKITGIDATDELPSDVDQNTATVGIKQLCQDLQLAQGFSVHIEKNIPLSSGMGGSAASAVAAMVACNAFLTEPLSMNELIHYALMGEAVASGQPHGDNIVPGFFGGLTLIQSLTPLDVISLPVPDVYCVLVHPHVHVNTKQARGILQPHVLLTDYVHQSAHLASFIAAVYRNDLALLKRSMHDIVIEPQRAHLVPKFYEMQRAALAHGAINASFSGSGPSVFALAMTETDARAIAGAMRNCLAQANIESEDWISRISTTGARVENRV
jgi:homoserine kinase